MSNIETYLQARTEFERVERETKALLLKPADQADRNRSIEDRRCVPLVRG